MVFQIPVHKPLHARLDRCLRAKSNVLHQITHIGEGDGNISRLHGQEVLLSLLPQGPLEEFDQIKTNDVILPTSADREIRIRCVTTPDESQRTLLGCLGITIPARLGEPRWEN